MQTNIEFSKSLKFENEQDNNISFINDNKAERTITRMNSRLKIMAILFVFFISIGISFFLGTTYSAFSSTAKATGSISFAINGHSGTINLTNADVVGYDNSNQLYTKFTIRPETNYEVFDSCVITMGSTTLTQGTHYTYSNNVLSINNTTINSNVAINIVYSGNVYGITYYYVYEGTSTLQSSLTPNTYTYGTGLTLPTTMTNGDKVFKGWYDNSALSGTAITTIPATSIGNRVFYGKWEDALANITISFTSDSSDCLVKVYYSSSYTSADVSNAQLGKTSPASSGWSSDIGVASAPGSSCYINDYPEDVVYVYFYFNNLGSYFIRQITPTGCTYEQLSVYVNTSNNNYKYGCYLYKISLTEKRASLSIYFRSELICFTGDTLVWCDDGSETGTHKRIDEISIGDKVYSYNEETKEINKNEVLFVKENIEKISDMVYIDVGETTINATAEHRFLLKDGTWKRASELQIGDELATSMGTKTIDNISYETKIETTYNLTVANDHTYFITESNIIVHNVY